MKGSAVGLFLLLALVTFVGVIGLEVAGFRKDYSLKIEQSSQQIEKGILQTLDELSAYHEAEVGNKEMLIRIQPGLYLINLNQPVNNEILQFYIRSNLRKEGIDSGFTIAQFTCEDKKFPNLRKDIPIAMAKNYFLVLDWPGIRTYSLNQLNSWWFSLAAVVVLLLVFSYALFLIIRQKQLAQIQRDFINNMAHEIRTPLSSIQLASARLELHGDKNKRYLSIIEQECNRLKNQLDGVLGLAPDGLSPNLDFASFSMHELLMENFSDWCNDSPDCKLVFNLKAENPMVSGDALHVYQVVQNILENARKYRRDVPLEIEITSSIVNSKLQVSIKDNGMGIESRHLKRIFKPFYRIPNGNVHNVKGFGIGLSYVQKMMKLHQGSVAAESIPGVGSVFYLIFPAA